MLHLVRDPRATAWSFHKTPELNYAPATVALIWNFWNPTIELLWGRRRARYLRLRYEDFALGPQAAARRILDFVGEPAGRLPFLDDRAVELEPTHSAGGNPSRFRTGRVEIRLDDEWRRVDVPGRRAVAALTFPLRRRYAYSAGARRRAT